MGGRFLSAPFFLSLIIFSRNQLNPTRIKILTLVTIHTIALLLTPAPPIFCDRNYSSKNSDYYGIVDEKGIYFYATGLLNNLGQNKVLQWWEQEKSSLLKSDQTVVVGGMVGAFGYHAGPELHIIDIYALTDPLLARLPASKGKPWRVGHYERELPAGYFSSIQSGQNKINDPDLATYYSKLKLLTQGELFSKERLLEIWYFLTGKNNSLLVTSQ